MDFDGSLSYLCVDWTKTDEEQETILSSATDGHLQHGPCSSFCLHVCGGQQFLEFSVLVTLFRPI